MRLTTPASVVSLLGLQNTPATLAAAGVVLDASMHAIETFLDTELRRAERTDYFTITRDTKVDPVLRLTSSFVSRDDPIVVTQTTTGSPLLAYPGTPLDDSMYTIDYDRGLVYMHGSFYAGRHSLSVAYVSGLEVSTTDATAFANVPDELAQSHANMAAAHFLLNPTNVPKEKAKNMGRHAVDSYVAFARKCVALYERPRAVVVWPSFTQQNVD